MKVLHISSAKTIRGGEHQICLLISELSSKGVKSILLCPTGSELSKQNIKGLEKLVTYMKLTPANILVSAFIKKLANRESIDIIHLHDPHSHQYAYFSYKLFRNEVPGVVTRRVSFPVKSTSRQYYLHDTIKKVICVSSSVKNSLSNLKLKNSKLIVIPSGIDLEQNENNISLRSKFKIDPEKKIVANLAAISPQKDYVTFIKTVKEFVDSYEDKAIFVIIGADGGMMHEVKSLASKLDLKNEILFTGFIPDAYKYLSDVDVLLSTSISEGLGNTIMEAMKYEIPIVGTNCEGTIDLVNNESSALLADIGDFKQLASLINRILSDQQLVQKLTKNAYADIDQYSIKHTTKQVLGLYNEVVEV